MIPLNSDEMLILRGKEGTLGMVKAGDHTQYFIETEKEEILLGFAGLNHSDMQMPRLNKLHV